MIGGATKQLRGPEDVVEDRFRSVGLEQRDVFMGRGVENNLRRVSYEHMVEPRRRAQVADDRDDLDLTVGGRKTQLAFGFEDGVFILVEQDDRCRIERR